MSLLAFHCCWQISALLAVLSAWSVIRIGRGAVSAWWGLLGPLGWIVAWARRGPPEPVLREHGPPVVPSVSGVTHVSRALEAAIHGLFAAILLHALGYLTLVLLLSR